ncbi:NAD(P)-binding protein [Viridothelium virens]|uniref:NAD(P)-binding protein n=1 Tax=Viridothelium virens TaxID=1048519 RepID=A0A6A6HKI6_VIRVR|nr:NAD(P)-binding protein [Viridothelium virens]
MAPKLFLTGTTGYIGGTVLDTLVAKHPEYEITALLRNVPSNFTSRYPKVNIVKGDYDSAEVISDAASKANVVVHSGNSDHEPSIKALIAGLLKRDSTSFLIHLGGTGVVADWQQPDYLGRVNPKVWSDIENIDEIISLPDKALHRNVDKIILDAGAQNSDKVKTAIICPPDIYGPGRGPARTNSVYFPAFFEEIKKLGTSFYPAEGTNTRSWVHIEDLMTLYVKLIEAAIDGGGNANWGKEGYYFASSQEASQLDIAKATGRVLHKHGLISSSEPQQLPLDQVDGMVSSWGIPHIATYMFAANSRTRADRAKAVLSYEPRAPSLWDSLEADLLACK